MTHQCFYSLLLDPFAFHCILLWKATIKLEPLSKSILLNRPYLSFCAEINLSLVPVLISTFLMFKTSRSLLVIAKSFRYRPRLNAPRRFRSVAPLKCLLLYFTAALCLKFLMSLETGTELWSYCKIMHFL